MDRLNECSYHSAFGGMWIDRSDFPEQLKKRSEAGLIDESMAQLITQFERDGYVILEGAASEDAIQKFEPAITEAFRVGHSHLICQDPLGTNLRVKKGMERRRMRVVDTYAIFPEALELLASPRLVQFMTAVFDDAPCLFQSLSFDMGSEQGLHQDTAYVVIDRPMEMLACWIALEDVRPGSGELQYLVGSHRLPEYKFGGTRKHWIKEIDGEEQHEEWAKRFHGEYRDKMKLESFYAKRGDILVWHGDLAHGGSFVKDPQLTRKSLVGHYCPDNANPHFFSYAKDRLHKKYHEGMSYCSWHYDLSTIDDPEYRDKHLNELFMDQEKERIQLQIEEFVSSIDAKLYKSAGLPPGFDARRYLFKNSDVWNVRLNPYEHFIKYGKDEGREW